MADGKAVGRRPGGDALDLARGVMRCLADMRITAMTEFTLGNGRRVDAIGLGPDGALHIVEIKSCRTDFLTDRKWQSYVDFADFFYFAVAVDFPRDVLPAGEGLILADRFGAEVVRLAQHRPVPAARRRALTLRFARVAAGRLMTPMLETPDSLLAQLE